MSEMAFHEKAGRSQGNSGFIVSYFLFAEKSFLPPSSRCRHASIRTLEERSRRSVHVGRSRYSRCCYLISALWFSSFGVEPWARRLTQSPELGFGFCPFSSWNDFGVGFAVLFYAAAVIAIRSLLCKGSYTSPLSHR